MIVDIRHMNSMNGYAGVLEDEKRIQDLERRVAQIKTQ